MPLFQLFVQPVQFISGGRHIHHLPGRNAGRHKFLNRMRYEQVNIFYIIPNKFPSGPLLGLFFIYQMSLYLDM